MLDKHIELAVQFAVNHEISDVYRRAAPDSGLGRSAPSGARDCEPLILGVLVFPVMKQERGCRRTAAPKAPVLISK